MIGPVVALVAWTLVVMIWMYSLRFPAMRRKGISLKGRVGSKGGSLDGVIEDQVQWKAHNYNHLLEQPTLFYAVALSLALLGVTDGLAVFLAWAYVGLRVAHSLVQATINVILYRFYFFAAASFALLGLTIMAGVTLIGWS
ncbi:MAG: MAPEG family protein [Sphingosinicella sp.]|nr:MAPEG family protein [Sphingosinicella sp.]